MRHEHGSDLEGVSVDGRYSGTTGSISLDPRGGVPRYMPVRMPPMNGAHMHVAPNHSELDSPLDLMLCQDSFEAEDGVYVTASRSTISGKMGPKNWPHEVSPGDHPMSVAQEEGKHS